MMRRLGAGIQRDANAAVHQVTLETKALSREVITAGLSARAANAIRSRFYAKPEVPDVGWLYSNFRRADVGGESQDIFAKLETGGPIEPSRGQYLAVLLPSARKLYGKYNIRVTPSTFTALTGLKTFTRDMPDGSKIVFAKEAPTDAGGRILKAKRGKPGRPRGARKRLRTVPVFRLVRQVTLRRQYDYDPVRDFARRRLKEAVLHEIVSHEPVD